MPVTPTYTPVTSDPMDPSGVWPAVGIDISEAVDQPITGETLGLIQAESDEPFEMEGEGYIFEEGT